MRWLERGESDDGFEDSCVKMFLCWSSLNSANSILPSLFVVSSAIGGFCLWLQIKSWWWGCFVWFCVLSKLHFKKNDGMCKPGLGWNVLKWWLSTLVAHYKQLGIFLKPRMPSKPNWIRTYGGRLRHQYFFKWYKSTTKVDNQFTICKK